MSGQGAVRGICQACWPGSRAPPSARAWPGLLSLTPCSHPRGRLLHGRHFTYKSITGDMAITFVSTGVEGAFATEEHPYAAHGPWLQVRRLFFFSPPLSMVPPVPTPSLPCLGSSWRLCSGEAGCAMPCGVQMLPPVSPAPGALPGLSFYPLRHKRQLSGPWPLIILLAMEIPV